MPKKNSKPPSEAPDLEMKLQQTDSQIQEYISKLHRKIRKLEIDNMFLQDRVKVLEKENLEYIKHKKDLDSLTIDEMKNMLNKHPKK